MERRRFRDTLYYVSSCGRVWNMKRGVELTINYGSGYGLVKLIIGKKGCRVGKSFLIHRMVAECFLDVVEGKTEINHKDGDKRNNRVDNLEWCTRKENLNHAYVMGLIEINPANWVYGLDKKERVCKLDHLVDEIRGRVIGGESYDDLAKEYGVSSGLIYCISNGRGRYKIDGEGPSEIKKRANREKREAEAMAVFERKKKMAEKKLMRLGISAPAKANWDFVINGDE